VGSDGDIANELRDKTLRAVVASLSFGCLPVIGLFLFQGLAEGIIGTKVTMLMLALLAFPLLWLAQRWLSYRALVAGVLGMITLIAAMSTVFAGLTPGGSLLLLLLIFLGGLFWGPRGTLFALLACTVLIVLCAALVLSGTIGTVNREYWNPDKPLVWVRYLVVFIVTAGSLAFALSSMIRKLEESIGDLQQALIRERAERAQREKVEAALERSKRLEAMGQLAGGIAHDFNNTLTVVLGMSDLIERATQRDEVISATQTIREAALNSANTAKQMLLLGRKEQVTLDRVRLSEPLKALERAISHAVPSGVSVDVESDTDAEIMASGSRLQHALLNIALNAADATQHGTITVRCRPCAVEQEIPGWKMHPGQFVCVSVADTGSGMTEATMQRIFEPFFTTKEPGKGTGLGLAMVRSTVYDAGGFINVESTVGKGTTFSLYFPAA
jgi:signal transduction histidine kinase